MEMNFKKKLSDLKTYLKQGSEKYKQKEKAEFAAGNYNPMADNKEYRESSQKMFVEGIKAPFKMAKAKAQTRKNINSMANTAARQQLIDDRKLPSDQKGAVNLKRRQDAKYKEVKRDLKKQVPKKYR